MYQVEAEGAVCGLGLLKRQLHLQLHRFARRAREEAVLGLAFALQLAVVLCFSG